MKQGRSEIFLGSIPTDTPTQETFEIQHSRRCIFNHSEAWLEAFLHYKTVIFSTDLNPNWHKFLKRSTFSNFIFVEIIMHRTVFRQVVGLQQAGSSTRYPAIIDKPG